MTVSKKIAVPQIKFHAAIPQPFFLPGSHAERKGSLPYYVAPSGTSLGDIEKFLPCQSPTTSKQISRSDEQKMPTREERKKSMARKDIHYRQKGVPALCGNTEFRATTSNGQNATNFYEEFSPLGRIYISARNRSEFGSAHSFFLPLYYCL